MRGMVARSIAPGKQELRTASGSCPDDLMLIMGRSREAPSNRGG